MAKITDKKLVLESGEEFPGHGFGGDGARVCELVFNTSMFAYQDIIADPASAGLLVLMTYPIIGSMGITGAADDCLPCVGGLVVREYNDVPSNFRSEGTLGGLLRAHDIACIEGLDTRRLTRMLRDGGSRLAVIVNASVPTAEALAMIKAHRPARLLDTVGCRERYRLGDPESPERVALIDCGAKRGLAEGLAARGCAVTVFPHDEQADEIAALRPHGIVVAGGPGSPAEAKAVTDTVKKLIGRFPIFGVGLGFCLVAVAHGAEAVRMPVGHRGGNRPMRWLESGKINCSARNCGWALDEASLNASGMKTLCRDLLDGTVMAAADRKHGLFGTLHNPELCGDTQDSDRLMTEFVALMKEGSRNA